MQNSILIILLFLTSGYCWGQTPADALASKNAVSNLETYVTALVKDSAELLIQFTIPADTAKRGGIKSAKALMKMQRKSKEQMGLRISNSTVYPPAAILHVDSTLQCAMCFVLEVSAAFGPSQKQSQTMVGISYDGGTRWYFIKADRGGATALAGIRYQHPEISPDLVIPEAMECQGRK